MFGTNTIMKQDLSDDGSLWVKEIFPTIQGEGPFMGEPATFVRLGGCNLKCYWCFGSPPGRKQPRVSLANSTKKKLKEVVKGDIILTFDEEFNVVETTVTETHKRDVDEWLRITIDGRQYFVTNDHPFMTPEGVIVAKDLKIGDEIYEVHPNEIISFKKKGDRNPMKDSDVAMRSSQSTNYVEVGERISATISKKQKDGTYVHAFSALTEEQRSNVREKASNSKLGLKNPMYNGLHNNRNKLKEEIKQGLHCCEACERIKYLEVHHVDGDDSNDDSENLMALCKSCHTKTHQKGYSFWNGNRRDGKQLKTAMKHNGKMVEAIKQFNRNNYPPSLMPKPLTVYNLTCSPYNTFFLDNMWVHNCDTDFESDLTQMSVADILTSIEWKGSSALVVLSGGEPMRQNIVPLIGVLLTQGYRVQIETAGTLWVSDLQIDSNNLTIVCSPKTGKVHEMMQHAHAWKYIIQKGATDPDDGLPVMSTQIEGKEKRLARPTNGAPVYVQPLDEQDSTKNEFNLQETARIACRFLYRVSIQMHKIIGVP